MGEVRILHKGTIMVRLFLSVVSSLFLILLIGCNKQTITETSVPNTVADRDIKSNVYATSFDQLWAEMDRHYSYFELKKIDWPALKARYRPQAEAATSTKEFVAVLQRMLSELKDNHVSIDGPEGRVFTHKVLWDQNWSFPGMQAHVVRGGMVGKFASIGVLKEGYGLLCVESQIDATPELAQQVVEKIEALGDVPGFIVDLRNATGGNEAHSTPLAAAFCSKPTLYARQKFRNGPGHSDFGPTGERTLPAGKKPFTKPVVVLLGSRTISSGEGLAMMFAALPNVTTVGSPTQGSSGSPMPFELKEVGVTVNFSRWVAMLPDGTPIEGRGVFPQVEARFPVTAFGEKDPVFEKGIEVLKEKVK